MASYDSSQSTSKKRVNRIYSDLDLDFTRNPVTSDVVKLTDVEAVKRSVRNLVNTNKGERPFHPEIGCGIRGLLFEPAGPLTSIAGEKGLIQFSGPPSLSIKSIAKLFGSIPSCLTIPAVSLINHSSFI